MDNEALRRTSRIEHVLIAQEQMKSLESKGESYLAAPALNDVLADNIGLVNLLISRDLRGITFKPRVGMDELRQEGLLSLARSALTFDPEMGSFSNYAALPIKNRCKRYGRLLMTSPRVPVHAMDKYVQAMHEGDLWGEHFDSSLEFVREIPDVDGVNAETLANVHFSQKDTQKVDYDLPSISENDQQIIETYFGDWDERFEETPRQLIDDSQGVMFERAFEVEEAHSKLEEIHRKLAFVKLVDPRMHKIIERRLLYPVDEAQPTLEYIGNELGLSRERIRQIEVRALELLRDSETFGKYEARFNTVDRPIKKEHKPAIRSHIGRQNKNALYELDLSSEELYERLSILNEIDERMAQVVRMRYLGSEKPTQEEIAQIFGITQTDVSKLERQALQLMGRMTNIKLKQTKTVITNEAVLQEEQGLIKNRQNDHFEETDNAEEYANGAILDLNKIELEQRLSLLRKFNPWLATIVNVRYLSNAKNLSEAAQILGVSVTELHVDEHIAISWLRQTTELAARVRIIESYGDGASKEF